MLHPESETRSESWFAPLQPPWPEPSDIQPLFRLPWLSATSQVIAPWPQSIPVKLNCISIHTAWEVDIPPQSSVFFVKAPDHHQILTK